jgi:hypothetical protein
VHSMNNLYFKARGYSLIRLWLQQGYGLVFFNWLDLELINTLYIFCNSFMVDVKELSTLQLGLKIRFGNNYWLINTASMLHTECIQKLGQVKSFMEDVMARIQFEA